MKTFKKRKLLWFPSLAFALVLFVPTIAWAQATAPQPTALEEFHAQVMNILIPVFVTLIGSLATWLLLKIKAKLHLDVSDKTMTQWTDLARAAALRGGEWARQKSKGLVEGKKLPGGEVMDVAAKWAIQMAEHQKLPEMAREKLEGLIESELFKLRREQAVEVAGDPKAGAGVPSV